MLCMLFSVIEISICSLGLLIERIKWFNSLLCHCPPWKVPDAGKWRAFPQCEAAPADQVKAALKRNYYYYCCCYRMRRCDLITWWSLSFSSQMILSTSLLLSFFTVCTSADVDRCCSWKIKTRDQYVSACWADGVPSTPPPPSSKGIDIHLDQTQCIQTEVEIPKEEERCRRVALIWDPTGRQDC